MDRMEIIPLQGYSEEEKVHIANRYLIPRQIKENGITAEQIEFPEEAVRHIIRHYTREAGVRKLEQTIGTVCRKQARRVVEGHTEKLVVTREMLKEFLGGIQVRVETEVAERVKRPGVAVGLAWTPAGGDILFIEANKMKGKGGFTMTGQIGEVMQESMQAALTWVRSNAARLGLAEDFTKEIDLHIHVPAGAIPKDGPSAGVTMATVLASLLTDTPVRPLTAMTGEITLSGNVLPVGGIKEKFLAARRAGVETIILPAENRQNVEEDLTPEMMEGVTVHYASQIEDVLAVALPMLAARPQLQPAPVIRAGAQRRKRCSLFANRPANCRPFCFLRSLCDPGAGFAPDVTKETKGIQARPTLESPPAASKWQAVFFSRMMQVHVIPFGVLKDWLGPMPPRWSCRMAPRWGRCLRVCARCCRTRGRGRPARHRRKRQRRVRAGRAHPARRR